MRGKVHILVYCPIDTFQWGPTHSAMGKQQAKMIFFVQLAYECTEDKDNVDNHEHFNGSETICLKWFGYTKNYEQQQQTFGILLVMLLKILTRTRKTVTRIVILPGTLSGGTRKLGKGIDQHF